MLLQANNFLIKVINVALDEMLNNIWKKSASRNPFIFTFYELKT